MSSKQDRLLDIYRRLLAFYGPQGWWPAETPFEMCVGAILTQATAWRNVELAIARLKDNDLLSPGSLIAAGEEVLADLIRPSGYYRQKAARLISLDRYILSRGSSMDWLKQEDPKELRQELLAVNGIGPETADSILLYAGNHPVFVVDAYTRRILHRLGLIQASLDYHRIQQLFMDQLPKDPALYQEYHALIVALGKEACNPKPRCGLCPLRDLCPTHIIPESTIPQG
ncbi:MAG: endonuclease III domain-containing protein [Limnochordia bacterium]